MPLETEVISCPACRHALRVPADWLGQAVQCPECQAKFRAPVREGGGLTAPALLSAPAPATATAPRGRADWMLTLPAFGLMLIGAAAAITDGWSAYVVLGSADGGKGWLVDSMLTLRKMGLATPDPHLDQRAQDEQAATELTKLLRWVLPLATLAGALTFAGGLAMVVRKWHRLAQVGCVLASVNLPNLFCIPGALFGLWGLLLLASEEGREHFKT